MPFEIRSGVQQGCALSPTLFNYITDWISGQALQDYPQVQVGANIHVPNLAYGNDIVLPSSSYSYVDKFDMRRIRPGHRGDKKQD